MRAVYRLADQRGACQYGAQYFNNVGIFFLCIDTPILSIYPSIGSYYVIVALSVTGETQPTLKIVTPFKNRGCPVISITSSSSCTLARMRDCSLAYYMPHRHNQDYFEVTSQIPVIYLIESLGRSLQKNRNTLFRNWNNFQPCSGCSRLKGTACFFIGK